MKVYIAGPMRGYPEFNFPAFFAAEERLEADGHEVFNPARRDNEEHGTDISKGNETGDEAQAAAEHGFNIRTALAADLEWICLQADAVLMLEGWTESAGATAERAVARALNLPIYGAVE